MSTESLHDPVIPLPLSFDVSALHAWLGRLPRRQPLVAANSLLAVLKEMLRSAPLPGQWFASMETLRPAVLEFADRTEAVLLDSKLPYSDAVETQGQLAQTLHLTAARNYARAAIVALSGDSNHDWLADAPSRAINHFGRCFLLSSQLYRAPGRSFWTELYRLFELVQKAAPDGADSAATLTANADFKRILILAISNVFRLRQREMRQYYAELARLSDLVRMTRPPVARDYPPDFCLNLADARAPLRYLTPVAATPDNLFLHTRRLADTLADLAANAGSNGLDSTVLQRVARTLGGPHKRKFSRLPDNGSCRLVFGLGNLLKLFLQASFPSKSKEPANFQVSGADSGTALTSAARDVNGPDEDDDWRAFRNESVLFKQLSYPEIDRLAAEQIWSRRQESAPPSLPPEAEALGQLVNFGAQGYCILWQSGVHASIRVGELVGVATSGEAPFLGVVRWLSVLTGGPIRFGVELLTPRAETVSLDDPRAVPHHEAIYMPRDRVLRNQPELLVSPALVQVGESITMSRRGRSGQVRFGELLESTPSFARFALGVEPGLGD